MTYRPTPLRSGYYYHIFNRGVEKRTVFENKTQYRHLLNAITYYMLDIKNLKYSYFLELTISERNKIVYLANQNPKQPVKLISYCLMPNHFHLLLRQECDNGISNFLRKITDSYTKYFNLKNNRVGPLFQGKFKSRIIESDSHLLHISRYIHLNPYTNGITKTIEENENYAWSSIREYIKNDQLICDGSIILSIIGGADNYKNFVTDQADYQRSLDQIKHLLCE